MDIKNLSQVGNLTSTISSNSSQNTKNTQKVSSNVSDESLRVSVNSQSNDRANSLSNTLKSLNSGIAISNIAQNALLKQEEILQNANKTFKRNDLSQLDENEQNEIRKDVVLALQNFNEIANKTQYNNQTFLNKDDYYLNIATPNSSFSIELPNTTKISDELITSFRQTSLNDENSIKKLSQDFTNQANNVGNIVKELKTIENSILEVAKLSIEEQINLSGSNFDFQNNINEFSKNNIISQNGYLVSSQANSNQFQSVRLLS